MPDVLIRDFDQALLRKLERRALGHGRTVEEEARAMLETALGREETEAGAIAATIRESLSGRDHTDSALLLAEDRGK